MSSISLMMTALCIMIFIVVSLNTLVTVHMIDVTFVIVMTMIESLCTANC